MSENLIWKANIFASEIEIYKAAGYNIGEPRASESLSMEELKSHDMVGIYVTEEGDPHLDHGEIYFCN